MNSMMESETEKSSKTSQVRVEEDIASMCNLISAVEGVSVSKIVSPILRGPITKLWKKAVAKLKEQEKRLESNEGSKEKT